MIIYCTHGIFVQFLPILSFLIFSNALLFKCILHGILYSRLISQEEISFIIYNINTGTVLWFILNTNSCDHQMLPWVNISCTENGPHTVCSFLVHLINNRFDQFWNVYNISWMKQLHCQHGSLCYIIKLIETWGFHPVTLIGTLLHIQFNPSYKLKAVDIDAPYSKTDLKGIWIKENLRNIRKIDFYQVFFN